MVQCPICNNTKHLYPYIDYSDTQLFKNYVCDYCNTSFVDVYDLEYKETKVKKRKRVK